MSIVETQRIYKIDDSSDLEFGLMDLIDEAENWGYDGDFVLEHDGKKYMFNIDIMNRMAINWNKDKAVRNIGLKNLINPTKSCIYVF